MAKGGLRIHTTLDPQIQEIAEAEVQHPTGGRVGDAGRRQRCCGGGAACDGRGPGDGGQRRLQQRGDRWGGQHGAGAAQPGSAIKPFTYLAAFEMPAAVKPDPEGPVTPRSASGR